MYNKYKLSNKFEIFLNFFSKKFWAKKNPNLFG